jgi:hypothetical protein
MKPNEDLDKAMEIFLKQKDIKVAIAYYAIVMDSKISTSKTKALKDKYIRMKQSGLEYIAKKKLGK